MIKLAPVHKHELASFSYISIMMFAVTYVYGILRVLKESLILSLATAELISAIKIWVIWPVSVLVIVFYMKMTDRVRRTRLFHCTNLFFVSFFILFATVIYPNYDQACLHIGKDLVTRLPSLRYLVATINNWPCGLFYAFSEMWTTAMLSISVWEITNHITSVEQSKRFYPLFGAFRGFGLLTASITASYVATLFDSWQNTLQLSIAALVVAAGVLSTALMLLTRELGFDQLNSESMSRLENAKQQQQEHASSLTESVKHILKSPTILLITSLILCYGLSLNLIEGVWKKVVELKFASNANEIQRFIGLTYSGVGSFTIFFSLTGVAALKFLGWRRVAMATPLVFGLTGFFFFGSVLGKNSQIVLMYGLPALELATYMGAINQVFARSSKNSFFDTTKEMLYIPLSLEMRTKGKAAAETIGMRFGKGSGALIQQVLLAMFGGSTLIGLAPILGTGFFLVIAWWFYSIWRLDSLYRHKLDY